MTSPMIEVDGLSKRYRLGQVNARSLREEVERLMQRGRAPKPANDLGEFWALRDASFSVEPGEVVGVVGRNGAGKSTLLKILSRVTEPTAGRARIRGRVASLLEVGTGFHPELTGRENVFLNGTILGMSRGEVAAKFDEIVDFAEVEQFLDTPVKRYSSGMYVRLAFAVAAHLEPEVLIVDEVLAVGDAEFQKKCLGKMQQVSGRGGRTVLFVSHNMTAVRELCTRALLLEGGQVTIDGPAAEVVASYLSAASPATVVDLNAAAQRGTQRFSRLHRLELYDRYGRPSTNFHVGDPMGARILVEITAPARQVEVGLTISNRHGGAVHHLTSSWEGVNPDLDPGFYWFALTLPKVLLFPGSYGVGAWVLRGSEYSDSLSQEVGAITVLPANVTRGPNRMAEYNSAGGAVYAPSDWKFERVDP